MANIQMNGEKARYFVMLIFRDFDNLFEDVFVDFWTSRDYPGSHRQCLAVLNKVMYGDKISDLLESQKERFGEDKVSMWSLFNSSLISFLKLGYVDYGDLSDNRLLEIKARIEKLDREVLLDIYDRQHVRRKKRQNDLLAVNWDLVMQDIESGVFQIDDPLQEKDKQKDNELGEREKSELEKALENMLGKQPFNHDDPGRSGKPKKDSQSPTLDPNGDEILESLPEPTPQAEQELPKEFQELLKNLVRDRAEQEIEDQHLSLLKESAQNSLSDFDCGAGIKIRVKREPIPDPEKILLYNRIWPLLAPVSASIQKKLLAYLEDLGEEETVRGLINGKHLHGGGLHRRDGQFFKKRLEPTGRPEVAIAVLIDHSTSMEWEAKARGELNLFKTKAEAVAYAGLILYDFCVALGIPVLVVGHYADLYGRNVPFTVTLNINASFERIDRNDRYRVIDTECDGGNRDGTALQFCVHELSKRPEEIKLLLSLSDGDPTCYSSDEDGVNHIKQVLREAKRNMIRVFSAALDEDIENIKDIFSNDTGAKCYEMTDLARLPIDLIRIIKRYLV